MPVSVSKLRNASAAGFRVESKNSLARHGLRLGGCLPWCELPRTLGKGDAGAQTFLGRTPSSSLFSRRMMRSECCAWVVERSVRASWKRQISSLLAACGRSIPSTILKTHASKTGIQLSSEEGSKHSFAVGAERGFASGANRSVARAATRLPPQRPERPVAHLLHSVGTLLLVAHQQSAEDAADRLCKV